MAAAHSGAGISTSARATWEWKPLPLVGLTGVTLDCESYAGHVDPSVADNVAARLVQNGLSTASDTRTLRIRVETLQASHANQGTTALVTATLIELITIPRPNGRVIRAYPVTVWSKSTWFHVPECDEASQATRLRLTREKILELTDAFIADVRSVRDFALDRTTEVPCPTPTPD